MKWYIFNNYNYIDITDSIISFIINTEWHTAVPSKYCCICSTDKPGNFPIAHSVASSIVQFSILGCKRYLQLSTDRVLTIRNKQQNAKQSKLAMKRR